MQDSSSKLLFSFSSILEKGLFFFFSVGHRESTVHDFAYDPNTFIRSLSSEMDGLAGQCGQPHHFTAEKYGAFRMDNHAVLPVWY